MRHRPLVGLTVSAVLHAAVVAGILLMVPSAERLPPLFIDLSAQVHPPIGPAGPPRPAAVARPSAPRRAGGDRVIGRGGPPAPALAPERTAGQAETPPAPPRAPERTAHPPETPPAPPRVPERAASPPQTPPAPAALDVAVEPPVDDAPAPFTAMAPAEAPAAAGDGRTAQPDPGDGVGSPSSMTASAGLGADSSAAPSPGPGGRAGPGLAVAVPGGGSGEPGGVYAGYLGRLRQRVQEALRYPAAARRRGLTGTVTLEMTVLPTGAIGPVVVVNSSSHALLDEAALDTVRSLRPQPFPADLPARTLRVRLPVVFDLR